MLFVMLIAMSQTFEREPLPEGEFENELYGLIWASVTPQFDPAQSFKVFYHVPPHRSHGPTTSTTADITATGPISKARLYSQQGLDLYHLRAKVDTDDDPVQPKLGHNSATSGISYKLEIFVPNDPAASANGGNIASPQIEEEVPFEIWQSKATADYRNIQSGRFKGRLALKCKPTQLGFAIMTVNARVFTSWMSGVYSGPNGFNTMFGEYYDVMLGQNVGLPPEVINGFVNTGATTYDVVDSGVHPAYTRVVRAHANANTKFGFGINTVAQVAEGNFGCKAWAIVDRVDLE